MWAKAAFRPVPRALEIEMTTPALVSNRALATKATTETAVLRPRSRLTDKDDGDVDIGSGSGFNAQ